MFVDTLKTNFLFIYLFAFALYYMFLSFLESLVLHFVKIFSLTHFFFFFNRSKSFTFLQNFEKKIINKYVKN